MFKYYWLFCALIFFAGIALAIYSAEFYRNSGSDWDSIPPGFIAGLHISYLGAIGIAGGLIVKVIRAFLRKRRK